MLVVVDVETVDVRGGLFGVAVLRSLLPRGQRFQDLPGEGLAVTVLVLLRQFPH